MSETMLPATTDARKITGDVHDIQTNPTIPASRQTVQIKEPAGNLGAPERRLLRHLHAVAYEEIKRGITSHSVEISSLLLTSHKGYDQIKKAVANLQTTRVETDDGDGVWTSVQVLGAVTIRGGMLHFEFPAKMRAYMQSPALYHRISLRIIYHLRSRFSIILYEILAGHYRKKNPTWEVSLEDLHQYLGTQDKKTLQKFAEMKRTVLDKACEEISKRANFEVGYVAIKTGRRVTGVSFAMGKKDPDQLDVTRELLDQEMPLLSGIDPE